MELRKRVKAVMVSRPWQEQQKAHDNPRATTGLAVSTLRETNSRRRYFPGQSAVDN
jgi:hypothetical protein